MPPEGPHYSTQLVSRAYQSPKGCQPVASTSAVPTKRKQVRKKRIPGCAACTIRKIKCLRDPDEKGCRPCKAKGLHCQPQQGRSPSQQLELSPTSTSSELTDGELWRGLTSSILSLFFQLPQARLTILEETSLRSACEAVSFRTDELDPISSALIASITALGARVSDHPALAGYNAPRLENLHQTQDLVCCGRNRRSPCDSLLQRAIKEIDESGAMRTASLESVAALMITQGLAEHEPDLKVTARAFGVASMTHIKSILRNPGTLESVRASICNGQFAWSLFSKDSLGGTLDELGPVLTDDDVDLLLGGEMTPLANIFHPSFFVGMDAVTAFLASFRSTYYHLAMACRQASRTLTGSRATRRPRLDEPALQSFLSQLDLVGKAIGLLEEKCMAWVGPPGGEGKHFSGEGPPLIWGLVRATKMAWAGQLLNLYRIVSSRLSRLPPSLACDFLSPTASLNGQDDETAYAYRLQIPCQDVGAIAFDASRVMIAQLGAMLETGLPLAIIPATPGLCSTVKDWCAPMVRMLTQEEGGPEGYTYQAKMSELDTLARVLRFTGYAYDVDEAVRWLEEEIAKVAAQAALQPMGFYTLSQENYPSF